MRFYFFPRAPEPGKPGGITVSKRRRLPKGDFHITEYVWSEHISLWFIDRDKFTADERRQAVQKRYGIR